MKYLFFDLETTDINFTGQILQYSFLLTDTNFNTVDRLDGTITLSRTQIPNPEAIYATDINIEDHLVLMETMIENEKGIHLCNYNERDSLNIIKEWIEEKCLIEEIFLIGHNSTNFDVPYLRTSMIRNGINPYFNSNLRYVDTKNLCKYLYSSCESFRRLIKSKDSNLKKPFSLENISKLLGVLANKSNQTHQAWDDVDLLVRVCMQIRITFGFKTSTEHYHVSFNENGFALMQDFIYNDDGLVGILPKKVARFKNFNQGKYYLFLDVVKALEMYEKNKVYTMDDARKMLIWKKTQGGFLSVQADYDDNRLSDEQRIKIKETIMALEMLNITMENYFPEKLCDIEQHIYQMGYDGLNQLSVAINEFDKHRRVYTNPTDIYAKKLLTRYKLNNLKNDSEENFKKIFQMYFEYRYGAEGKMVIDKFATKQEDLNELSYHPCVFDYHDKISELCQKAGGQNNKIKKMIKLREYIDSFMNRYINE